MKFQLKPGRIILDLDRLDFIAVQEAVMKRLLIQSDGEIILPDGTSNFFGSVLAEICRAYIDDREGGGVLQIRRCPPIAADVSQCDASKASEPPA